MALSQLSGLVRQHSSSVRLSYKTPASDSNKSLRVEAPPRSCLSDAEARIFSSFACWDSASVAWCQNLLGVTFPPTVHSDLSFISAHRHPISLETVVRAEYCKTLAVLKDLAAPARHLIRSKALLLIGVGVGTAIGKAEFMFTGQCNPWNIFTSRKYFFL